MKKAIAVLSISSLLLTSLSGCGSKVTVNQEQNDLIAEYCANALLQNSTSYQDRYVTDKTTKITTEAATTTQVATTTKAAATTKAPVASSNNNGNATATTATKPAVPKNYTKDLSKLYKDSKVDVIYKKCEFTKSYSNGSDLTGSVDADSGNTLVVSHFSLKNSSTKKNHVSLLELGMKFSLSNESGEVSDEPVLTTLENDLSTLDLNLKPGQVKPCVVIFQVPKSVASSKGLELTVQYKGTASTIKLN